MTKFTEDQKTDLAILALEYGKKMRSGTLQESGKAFKALQKFIMESLIPEPVQEQPTIDIKSLKAGQEVILHWPEENRYSDWVTLTRPNPENPWLFVEVDGQEEYVVQTVDWIYAYMPPVVVVARREGK